MPPVLEPLLFMHTIGSRSYRSTLFSVSERMIFPTIARRKKSPRSAIWYLRNVPGFRYCSSGKMRQTTEGSPEGFLRKVEGLGKVPTGQPLTQTICFRVWTTSTRSLWAAMTASIGL